MAVLDDDRERVPVSAGASPTPVSWSVPALVSPVKARLALLLVIVIGTAARLPGLGRALTDAHSFRQTQTAYTIREIARHGPHLLHPALPVFGPPWTLAMEMPIEQAVAAVFVKMGLSSDVAGRLMGLLTFQLTAVLLYLLIRRWVSARAALLAVVLFQACPLAVQFGFASLMEFAATASALGALIALCRWLDGGRWPWLAIAAGSSVLAWLIKVTTAVPWVVPAVAVAFVFVRVDWRARYRRAFVGLAAAVGVGAVAGAWWTHYADNEKAASPYTAGFTSSALKDWNFGTLHQRLVFHHWKDIAGMVMGFVVGRWWVFGVALLALLFARRGTRLLLLSLAAVPAVAVGTFFNLYFIHSYYECAILPALVVVEAAAVEVALQRLPARLPLQSPAIVAVALAAIWGTSWTTDLGRGVVSSMETAPQPNPLGIQMRELTPPGSQFVMVGCSWDPEFLYYADRRGLMYLPGAPALDPKATAQEYQYVVSCPGQSGLSALPPQLRLRPINGYIWQIVGVGA